MEGRNQRKSRGEKKERERERERDFKFLLKIICRRHSF
jgi:hypothetical protein